MKDELDFDGEPTDDDAVWLVEKYIILFIVVAVLASPIVFAVCVVAGYLAP